MKNKSKVFYGWYVVAAGCLVIGMTAGIIQNSFGQYIKPVCADMGFSRQQMSTSQTIVSAVSMVFALLWGKISKKIHLHKCMSAVAVILPILYFCFSFISDLTTLYAVTILMSIAFCFVTMMVFTYIIGNWFVKNRGVAIGLTSMGSGIGSMIMNTVIAELIINYGWRMTYRIVAVIMLITIVPAIWFIVREFPSDKGLQPYGFGEKVDAKKKSSFEGYTFAEARRMPMFWAVFVSSVGIVMAICVFYQTVAPHLSDCGYSVTFAALMTSASMGALAVGKVVLGRLFDRFGSKVGALFACSCTLIGIAAMIFCRIGVMLPLIVLGVGFGCSFGAVCMPIITANIFGMKEYNSIYGVLTSATNLGAALAPVISGRVYDVSGSYTPIYVVCLFITAVGLAVLIKVLPNKDPS